MTALRVRSRPNLSRKRDRNPKPRWRVLGSFDSCERPGAGCHAFPPPRRVSMRPRHPNMLTPAAGESMPPSGQRCAQPQGGCFAHIYSRFRFYVAAASRRGGYGGETPPPRIYYNCSKFQTGRISRHPKTNNVTPPTRNAVRHAEPRRRKPLRGRELQNDGRASPAPFRSAKRRFNFATRNAIEAKGNCDDAE
jgi:hypothetical protein